MALRVLQPGSGSSEFDVTRFLRSVMGRGVNADTAFGGVARFLDGVLDLGVTTVSPQLLSGVVEAIMLGDPVRDVLVAGAPAGGSVSSDVCSPTAEQRSRLARLLFERVLREYALARFGEGGGPLGDAFSSLEKISLERARRDRIALDPEQNVMVARRTLTDAYRTLLPDRLLDEDPVDSRELILLAGAAAVQFMREAGDDEATGPVAEEGAGEGQEPGEEDQPLPRWRLRHFLTKVVCVQETEGLFGTTAGSDDIRLRGSYSYRRAGSDPDAPSADQGTLARYNHEFEKDGDEHDLNLDPKLGPEIELASVDLVPGQTLYLAQHLMFEEDLFAIDSVAAERLAAALANLVSLGIDFGLASVTSRLQEEADEEQDPQEKEQRKAIVEAWKRIVESDEVKGVRDKLEGTLEAFLTKVFKDDPFEPFITQADIDWSEPTRPPVWDVSQVRGLERGKTPQLFSVPDRVIGEGTAFLDGIRVLEVGREIGEYRLSMRYQMDRLPG